jgi:hypothetical protein
MSDEPPVLDYSSPPQVPARRNARASISLWMSIFFPLISLFTSMIGGGIAMAVEKLLPNIVGFVLGGLVWGAFVFWPIVYSLVSGIRAVLEIRRTRERGLWQAIVGIILSSLFGFIALLALLPLLLRL